MKYQPVLSFTERGGDIAVWINFPSGKMFNIWDLTQKELTSDVKKALASAFERGWLAMREMNQSIDSSVDVIINEDFFKNA